MTMPKTRNGVRSPRLGIRFGPNDRAKSWGFSSRLRKWGRRAKLALSKDQTRDLYRRRAAGYDTVVLIYRLFGIDLEHYRSETIDHLALKPGDTVVELGCGTGLNFERVERRIGPQGRLIGVDLTDRMLDVARARVAQFGWANVELIQADIVCWTPPDGLDGIYSTLALTLVPEYENVIGRCGRALKAGGRLAVFDMKEPHNWPHWLVKFAAWLNKPFGVSLELSDRHPWEAIRRNLQQVAFVEYYFGVLYLCVGQKPLGQSLKGNAASPSTFSGAR